VYEVDVLELLVLEVDIDVELVEIEVLEVLEVDIEVLD